MTRVQEGNYTASPSSRFRQSLSAKSHPTPSRYFRVAMHIAVNHRLPQKYGNTNKNHLRITKGSKTVDRESEKQSPGHLLYPTLDVAGRRWLALLQLTVTSSAATLTTWRVVVVTDTISPNPGIHGRNQPQPRPTCLHNEQREEARRECQRGEPKGAIYTCVCVPVPRSNATPP